MDPLYAFVFAGMFSPGPNVILIAGSGARFGFRASLPLIAGVVVGVGITSGLTGLGIGALLAARPTLAFGLRIAAALWICYMAWMLFNSTRQGAGVAAARPFRFHQGLMLQWVNPKVWAVALAAASGYGAGLSPLDEAVRLASAFSGINLFVCLFWSGAGALLALLLKSEAAWRRFTIVMALLLAASAGMVFL